MTHPEQPNPDLLPKPVEQTVRVQFNSKLEYHLLQRLRGAAAWHRSTVQATLEKAVTYYLDAIGYPADAGAGAEDRPGAAQLETWLSAAWGLLGGTENADRLGEELLGASAADVAALHRAAEQAREQAAEAGDMARVAQSAVLVSLLASWRPRD